MIQTAEEFYAWERNSRDIIDVKRCYVDIAGDLATGVLLSQIIYWYLPDYHGQSKVGVERDNKIWLVKSRGEWWQECRLTPRQIDRSIKSLKVKGLIETGRFRFKGLTPLHIWLNLDAVIEALNHQMVKAESPDGKSGVTKNVKAESPKAQIPYLIKTNNIKTTTEILAALQRLPKWTEDSEKDRRWLDDFQSEFPELTLTHVKACCDYWDGKITKHKGQWKTRLRNWIQHEKTFIRQPSLLPTGDELERQFSEKGLDTGGT